MIPSLDMWSITLEDRCNIGPIKAGEASLAPGTDKALQQNRLGLTGWEQFCRTSSAGSSLAVSMQKCSLLSGAAQAGKESACLERDLALAAICPAWHKHCHNGVCPTEASEAIRTGALDIQGEDCKIWVCSAFKRTKGERKHDCYPQVSNVKV